MHYQSISDLSSQIRRQALSPVEVVDASLRRIQMLNPRLNAFITVMFDEARQQARIAESEITAGGWRGPLHGVPVAVKDFYDTAGVRTTAGAAEFRDRVPDTDAEVVRRLKQAGAVIVGKTNMDALGMATTGLTGDAGPVRNPWNADYVSGGSSAGSAAAVAAGLCWATVDTDAVGSVRLPAACCGVTGFKGSFDLISTRGILGDQPVDKFIRWMGHAGVTARGAGDVAIMLDALADPVGRGFATGTAARDERVRIGVGDNFTASSEVRTAFEKAVRALQGSGYEMGQVAVPFGDSDQGDMANVEADRAGIAELAFSVVDVMILPTLPTTVPAVHDAMKDPEQAVSAEITAFANYYGLPAISMPCGFDRHGVPIGLQIVGKPGADRTVLNVAHQVEQAAPRGAEHPID
jgi:aspartyl-tRNA(Asn)/glutamyl-tRNA(Gln) amidotransferase subunit A